MRSLWRDLAVAWLGGEGSEALMADSEWLDRFALAPETPPPAVLVTRIDRVSHRALLRAGADLPQPMPAKN
jgi:hypothetical protein